MDSGFYQRFHDIAHCQKSVDENQFYFRDHVVAGHSLLPGVAYIEMALAIYHQIIGRYPRQLRNLVWLEPINSTQYKLIDIYLKDNATQFEVATANKGMVKVHAQGKFTQNAVISLPNNLNMQKLRTSFDRRTSNSECYAMLEKLQFGYGDCLRAIKDVEHNDTEALTHLVLPSQLRNEFTNYFLHPSLMDGAVQSAIALFGNANESITGLVPYVPFFVKSINIFNPLTSSCYAYIRIIRTEKDVDRIKKVNITIVDDQGRVLVDINEFVYKALSIEEIKGIIEINPSSEMHSRKVMEANAPDTKITHEPIYITSDWE
ncbi:MAG: polyketide synthase dehydratase domain-containing protein [Exilibacterium sp.]